MPVCEVGEQQVNDRKMFAVSIGNMCEKCPAQGLAPGGRIMNDFLQEPKQELTTAWVRTGEKYSRSSTWQDLGKNEADTLCYSLQGHGGRVQDTSCALCCGCGGGNGVQMTCRRAACTFPHRLASHRGAALWVSGQEGPSANCPPCLDVPTSVPRQIHFYLHEF